MADEIRVARDETVITPGPATGRPASASAPPPVPDYEDPRDARADIEATRARLSGTIDEIEDVLVRKKTEIQDRLDVTAPVRENPWPSMGIALGAGLFLGLLTGGDDDQDEDVVESRHVSRGWQSTGAWEHRSEVLEQRTRRLLSIAREQEEEIRRLRGGSKTSRFAATDRLDDDLDGTDFEADDDTGSGRLDDLRSSVVNGLTAFLLEAFRQYRRRS